MKCQKCGKSEVNFRFSSNINGCVTETHLCSECAAEQGYDIKGMFGAGNVFDSFFPIFGGPGGFFTMAMPAVVPAITGFAPFLVESQPRIDKRAEPDARECEVCGGCEEPQAGAADAVVDDEMKKRRELYMKMRAAAESEDFEKAAQIRDEIKAMEK